MIRRLDSNPHPVLLVSALAVAACLAAMSAGCKSGSGAGERSWANPFARSEKPAEKTSLDPVAAELAAAKRPAAKSGGIESLLPAKSSKRSAKSAVAQYDQDLIKARNLESSGKLDDARAAYEKLIALSADRYEAYHRLAVVCDRQRRHREALDLYTQAVERQAEDPELWNDLGYSLFLQGRLDQSERALAKAVAMAPRNARFRNNLGMVYGHQGRYDEAMEEFRQVGSDADAYYNMAFVLAAQGNDEGAKNCFHLALGVDPTYNKARDALLRFEEAEREPAGALDNGPIVANGVRWEPYIEGGQQASPVQQTSLSAPTAGGKVVPSTRPSTQGELRRARTGWTEGLQGAPQQ